MPKLRDFWNDDYYNKIIRDCAKTCKDCCVLKSYIGKQFETLDDKSKQHFKEIVINTYERLQFDL